MRDSRAFCLNVDFGFLLIPIFIHFSPKVTGFHFLLQLNKIPLYICTTFSLSIHHLFPLRLVPFLLYCLLCCLFPALGTKGAASLLGFPEPSPPSFLLLLWSVASVLGVYKQRYL